MRKERIEWVDISRGIGILLVIIGHCVYFGGFAHKFIFSFHMQLFFILSSLFFTQDTMMNCIKKKFKQLIVPYIVFCLIGLFVSILIPQWRGFTYKDILRDIYWGYPLAVNVSSVWFLVCLFFTVLLFNFILLIMNKSKATGWALLLAISVFGFLLGRYPEFLASFPMGRMPLDIDSACVALLFFALGYYFKERILYMGRETAEKSIIISIIGLILCIAITTLIVYLNETVNLHGIIYNHEVLYICGSIAGFLLVFFLSNIIQRMQTIKKMFKWFGENSLKIMGIQAIIVRLYLLIINNVTGSSYNLYFMPPVYAVLGCIFVTIISAAIAVAYNKAIHLCYPKMNK